MKINVQKIQKNSTTARDYRKIRSNPQFFLKRLSRRNWNVLENMKKVDDMVILRTKESNDCLDECVLVLTFYSTRLARQKFYLEKKNTERVESSKIQKWH